MPTRITDKVPRIVMAGFAAALFAALMVGAAGPLYRLKLADLGIAFTLLRWGAWLGLGAVVIALAGAWVTRPGARSRGFVAMLASIVLGGVAFGVPFAMLQNAKRVPPIHDITTDTETPPGFLAIVPLRSGAPNSIEYEGEAISKQQHAAYPDIQPATLAEPPDVAFQRALTIARELGWEIVAAVPNEGRIEATDTTIWFGFKDDIVIVVTPGAGGQPRRRALALASWQERPGQERCARSSISPPAPAVNPRMGPSNSFRAASL